MRPVKSKDCKQKEQYCSGNDSAPCERCGAVAYEVEEKDIVDVLEDLASQTNARVEVISTESEEKAKLTALGGFAAILRYRPIKSKAQKNVYEVYYHFFEFAKIFAIVHLGFAYDG